jgi:hypothetical protein
VRGSLNIQNGNVVALPSTLISSDVSIFQIKASELKAYTNGMSGIEVPITKMKMLSNFKSLTHCSDGNASDVR